MDTTAITKRYHRYKILLRIALVLYLIAVLVVPMLREFYFYSFVEFLLFTGLAAILGIWLYSFLASQLDKRCHNTIHKDEFSAQRAAESARFAAATQRLADEPLNAAKDPAKHSPIMDWCSTATKHVPKSRRSAVYAELMGHLLDHRDALVAQGYSTDAAEHDAIEAMGDPAAVAQQLKQTDRSFGTLVETVKYLCLGRSWTTILNTADEAQAYELSGKLAAAGIPFLSDQVDNRSFSLNALAVGRADGPSEVIRGMQDLTERGPEDGAPRHITYCVSIRKRDLTAAKVVMR